MALVESRCRQLSRKKPLISTRSWRSPTAPRHRAIGSVSDTDCDVVARDTTIYDGFESEMLFLQFPPVRRAVSMRFARVVLLILCASSLPGAALGRPAMQPVREGTTKSCARKGRC